MKSIAITILVLVASFFSLFANADEKTQSATAPQNTMLAIVMPDGRSLYVVKDFADRAIKQARDMAKTNAKRDGKDYMDPKPVVLKVFDSSRELYDAVGLPGGEYPNGMSILYSGRACNQQVPASDSGCSGSGNDWFRTKYFERMDCGPKNNSTCWENWGTIGRWSHYGSESDCDNGTNEKPDSYAIKGNYCNP